MLFIKAKKYTKIFICLVVLLCSLSVVSATDTNDTVTSVQTTTSDINNDDTVINSQTTDNVVSDDQIISSNKSIVKKDKSDNLKTASSGNFKELQQLIDETSDSGKIELTSDYFADSSLKTMEISKSITIDGNGHTLDARKLYRIFDIDLSMSMTVELSNLKFINGKLPFNNINKGLSWNNGGAIKVQGGTLIIKNCTFENNLAGNDMTYVAGGAVYSKSAHLKVYDSTFTNNSFINGNKRQYGGAIGVNGGSCLVSSCNFTNNKGGNYGGAIWADGSLQIYSSNFVNNSAISNGGAINSEQDTRIVSSNFTNNVVQYAGASLAFQGGDNYVTSCIFRGDTYTNLDDESKYGGANWGASIHMDTSKGSLNINNSVFLNNLTNLLSSNGAKIIANNNWWGNTVDNKDVKPNVEKRRQSNSCVQIDNWYYLDTGVYDNTTGPIDLEFKLLSTDNSSTWPVPIKFNVSSSTGMLSQSSFIVTDNSSISYNPLTDEQSSVTVTTDNYNATIKIPTKAIYSFTELQYLINHADNELTLTHNYTYNPEKDYYNAIESLRRGIKINKTFILDGNGYTIDGKNAARLIRVLSNNVTIKNINLINGYSEEDGGAILWRGDNGTLYNNNITSSHASSGGAVRLATLSIESMNMTSNYFKNNTASVTGGTITFRGNNHTFVNNTIEDGYAPDGIAIASDSDTFKQYENNTIFSSLSILQKLINNADGNLVLHENYTYNPKTDSSYSYGVKITKAIIIDGNNYTLNGLNSVRLLDVESNNVTIKNMNIVSGKIEGRGGAIYWNGHNGLINNTTFASNLAKQGGALFIAKQNVTVNNSNFTSNYARNRGGAIFIGNYNTTITNNLFQNNEAQYDYNKAVYWTDRKMLKTFNNNTYINNTQFTYGGNAEDDDESVNPTIVNRKYPRTITESVTRNLNKHDKIIVTSNSKQISSTNNKLTLDILNQIFNQDFTKGHLLVYIDGKLVFNDTTTDDLSQIIYNIINLLTGQHTIKVEFTDNEGKTNTYTENITV